MLRCPQQVVISMQAFHVFKGFLNCTFMSKTHSVGACPVCLAPVLLRVSVVVLCKGLIVLLSVQSNTHNSPSSCQWSNLRSLRCSAEVTVLVTPVSVTNPRSTEDGFGLSDVSAPRPSRLKAEGCPPGICRLRMLESLSSAPAPLKYHSGCDQYDRIFHGQCAPHFES